MQIVCQDAMREIANDSRTWPKGFRIQALQVNALKEAAENYINHLFEDIPLACRICGEEMDETAPSQDEDETAPSQDDNEGDDLEKAFALMYVNELEDDIVL